MGFGWLGGYQVCVVHTVGEVVLISSLIKVALLENPAIVHFLHPSLLLGFSASQGGLTPSRDKLTLVDCGEAFFCTGSGGMTPDPHRPMFLPEQ